MSTTTDPEQVIADRFKKASSALVYNFFRSSVPVTVALAELE